MRLMIKQYRPIRPIIRQSRPPIRQVRSPVRPMRLINTDKITYKTIIPIRPQIILNRQPIGQRDNRLDKETNRTKRKI